MTALEKLEANERKIELIESRGGMCEFTGCHEHENLQLAHRIPKSKYNLRVYGAEVIHHPLNLAVTCPKHNDSVLINFASNPIKASLLICQIRNAIREGEL
jgi:hypothetical protein